VDAETKARVDAQRDAFQAGVRQARRRNRRRDLMDYEHGHGAPGRCPLDVHIRTAMTAFETAIMSPDAPWAQETLFEGYAILEDVLPRLAPEDMGTALVPSNEEIDAALARGR
jgi:hypothetical protein